MKARFALVALVALVSLGSRSVSADTILYNSLLNPTAAGLIPISTYQTTANGVVGVGDSFSVGAVGTNLTSFTVEYYLPSTATGSVTASLYSNSGNTPGVLLDTFASFPGTTLTVGQLTPVTYTGFSPITLTAFTRYWILFSTPNGSPIDLVTTGNLTGPGVASEYIYANGAASTNAAIGGTFQLEVSAVPEPSSLALCGVALVGGIGFVARRRRLAV